MMSILLARRTRRKRRAQARNTLYVGVGVILIVAVIGISLFAFLNVPTKIARDPSTYCPIRAAPAAITTIVIDRTDSFSTISKADIEIQLRDVLDAAIENEEISLYVVEPIENSPLTSLITVCNPGNPTYADPWTQNPKLVQRNWRTKFSEPLEKLLNEMLIENKAPVSPIMESILSISVTNFYGDKRANVRKRLILVSDLLQNSQALSFYGNHLNFENFQRSASYRGLNPDLREVSFELLYLQRQTKQKIDEDDLLNFWKKWVESRGGEVVRILRVSGMNR